MAWVYLQYAITFILAGIAFWRGAGPEKAVGATLVGMIVAAYGYTVIEIQDGMLKWMHVEYGLLLVDFAGFVAFAIIAMRANRIYTIWLLGAQLISVLMHLGRGISSIIEPKAYYAIYALPFWMQILIFGIGLIAHLRRLRRFGNYRSWRTSSDQ